MLGQCANVEQPSCVFSRSIEVMHGMKHLGWSHEGDLPSNNPHDVIHSAELNICIPPTVDEYDINQIAMHAKDHCLQTGAYVSIDDDDYLQTVNDLKELVSMPECWEDLCHPMIKNMVIDEWMQDCAMVDLKFLTSNNQPLDHDHELLSCMMKFIIPTLDDTNTNWACVVPNIGLDVCNVDSGKDAYIHCGGEVLEATPPPSPPMHFSMSFAYNEFDDDYNWAQMYEPEMSFSYSFKDDFSMPYGHDDDDDDDWQHNVVPHEAEMLEYIDEVCSLIADLNSNTAEQCLEPICDDLWLEDALVFGNGSGGDANIDDDNDGSWLYDDDGYNNTTLSPTSSPTKVAFYPLQTPKPTMKPTTSAPSTKQPTMKPTPSPTTNQPSPSPTALVFGEIEVSFEVGITLEGLSIEDIDITKLDDIVDVLTGVFGDMLPEGAIVRIISVGGISVVRRVLRILQTTNETLDSSRGVDVEFEVILKEQCESLKCDNSDEMSEALYTSVTSDFQTKVESGELTSNLQDKAADAGLSELRNVSINSVQVSEATVTVREAQDNTLPVDDDETDNDDDSAASGFGTVLSLSAVVLSVFLHTLV